VFCEDHIEFHDHRLLRTEPQVRRYPKEFISVYSSIDRGIVNIDDVVRHASTIPRLRATEALELMIQDRNVLREGDRILGLSLTADADQAFRSDVDHDFGTMPITWERNDAGQRYPRELIAIRQSPRLPALKFEFCCAVANPQLSRLMKESPRGPISRILPAPVQCKKIAR
jgi:hypothetical protein